MAGMDRRIRDLEDAMEAHKIDAYAHGAMIGRIMQENLTLREKFENRLTATEKAIGTVPDIEKRVGILEKFREAIVDRIGTLENFKGQVTLLGGIGFLLLGVALAGLAQRIFGLHL